MSKIVDCYFTPISPWAYLGMARFRRIAAAHGAEARFRPVDIMQVFKAVGALPLAQRAPARQANRLQELQRWRDFLKMPLNLHPKHFPTDPMPACRLIAAAISEGDDGGELSQALLEACWVGERNIAEDEVLVDVANGVGLDGEALLARSREDAAARQVQAWTDEGLERGIIGSPCYVIGDQVFFGQDRLDFVERALAE